MTLKQLRYLGALAEHRHFGRAAEACAVTQPALSMQIRELEKDLGVDLVERRPGEGMLTEVGAEVARRAEHVLAAARAHGRVRSRRLRAALRPAADRAAAARRDPDARPLHAAADPARAAAALSRCGR